MIALDGNSLTIEQLVRIARHGEEVACDPSTRERVAKSEALIARVVENYRRAWEAGQSVPHDYGITTGFGEFKNKAIAPEDLVQLQRNLLLSHSVGVGENTDPDDLANYFPAEVVRGALATRLNAFLKGHSGVRAKLVEVVEAMLNCGVIPLVPLRGSVGASGDLCPLSHLFVTLLGEGKFYLASSPSDLRPASELVHVLQRELPDLQPEELAPTYKEGLALINGANFSSGMLALAVHDAELLADAVDTAAAFTLEVLCGRTRALDERVHKVRRHQGQAASAERMRTLVEGSSHIDQADDVQDAYSLRCAPQVHGASRDAIGYARRVATDEINAATDNPLFFPDAPLAANESPAYSAGNFHGQPIALAADFLSIAVAELANISERRTQALLDANQNRGLPSNLTTRPGFNSGLMIAQYTAASLVSENKVLAHPASVDSIPTGANAEDHVSMSTIAARKLGTVVHNAQNVLAIELLTVAQALEWRAGMKIDPLAPRRTMSIEESDDEARRFADAVRDPNAIAPAL